MPNRQISWASSSPSDLQCNFRFADHPNYQISRAFLKNLGNKSLGFNASYWRQTILPVHHNLRAITSAHHMTKRRFVPKSSNWIWREILNLNEMKDLQFLGLSIFYQKTHTSFTLPFPDANLHQIRTPKKIQYWQPK